MTGPAEAALRFGWGCLMGAGLGVCYDFLRPLRPKRTILADTVFVVCLFAAWVQLSFGICGGDLRLDYTASLGIGALIWIYTAGKLLRPVFRLFWWCIDRIISIITTPFQKIFEKIWVFLKKVFASMKKKGYNRME